MKEKPKALFVGGQIFDVDGKDIVCTGYVRLSSFEALKLKDWVSKYLDWCGVGTENKKTGFWKTLKEKVLK